jgi:predicted signal transduction protein with EAL and GGDEF domain
VPFDPRLRSYRLDRVRLGTGLRRAIDHGDLLVHYQLIIDLATGRMVGVEALARWQLPDGEVARSGWAFTGAILEAIASLDRKVIAEGVETPEQARALSDLRCAFAHGYLYSRPMPATDVDQMLKAGSGSRSVTDLLTGVAGKRRARAHACRCWVRWRAGLTRMGHAPPSRPVRDPLPRIHVVLVAHGEHYCSGS